LVNLLLRVEINCKKRSKTTKRDEILVALCTITVKKEISEACVESRKRAILLQNVPKLGSEMIDEYSKNTPHTTQRKKKQSQEEYLATLYSKRRLKKE